MAKRIAGGRSLGCWLVGALVIGCYLAFVAHFAVNQPSVDDWSVVPLIDAQLHNHLTWSALWAEHNENRFLFPNLILLGIGITTHYDITVGIFLGAGFMIAAFGGVVLLVRDQVRALTPWAVAILGVIWFSLADWQNALWSFQLAWYLIALLLVAMLYLLLVPIPSWLFFAAAALCAVVASYSSLQGLLLWPVGLIAVLWRRQLRGAAVWVAVGLAATIIYFVGYHAAVVEVAGNHYAPISSTYAFHHLWATVQFFVVSLGAVLPTNYSATHYWLGGLVGAVVLAGGLYVVAKSLRDRSANSPASGCAPLGLATFGLLFALTTAIGRVQLGLAYAALTSRYTMAPLIILTAVAMYAIVWWSTAERTPVVKSTALVLCVLLSLLGVLSTTWGVSKARAHVAELTAEAQLVVNRSEIPKDQAVCYTVLEDFLYDLPSRKHAFEIDMLQRDHLSVFASPQTIAVYRSKGLPQFTGGCHGS